jgi:RNA polymerase sporulation-specific sigma factor
MKPDAPDQLLFKISDFELACRVADGCDISFNEMARRYNGLIWKYARRLFLAGGDSKDLFQEGLLGLEKACRDFRPDRDASFRTFADLCISRNIITAIKAGNCGKHGPLNNFMSFSQGPPGDTKEVATLENILAAPEKFVPDVQVIASEELHALIVYLSTKLSEFESKVLALRLDGYKYQEISQRLERNMKTIDNAIQRVRRKVALHFKAREKLSELPEAD